MTKDNEELNKILVKADYIRTSVDEENILLTTDIMGNITKSVVNLQEEAVRKVLIDIGWTPPERETRPEPKQNTTVDVEITFNGDGGHEIVTHSRVASKRLEYLINPPAALDVDGLLYQVEECLNAAIDEDPTATERLQNIHKARNLLRRFLHTQGHLGGGWQPIETAPSYKFEDENPKNYLIRARGDTSGRIIHAIGHFKEDGFYLEEGGELSHAFTPVSWAHIPPEQKEGE